MYRKHSPLTSACSIEPLERRTLASASLPTPDHVVVVVEENHSFSEIFRQHTAPYIHSLAKAGALFTNSHAITHPSQPNYLALFSGSTHHITDDSTPHTFSGPNLGSELIAANHTFIGYSQSLPSVGFTGDGSGSYERKHNPWVNFTNLPPSTNQPFHTFPTDFTKLPTLSFVVPNQDNDMHDGTIATADSWLQRHLGPYATWANKHNSLLIVTWDEDDRSANNHIPTLFYGPMVTPRHDGEKINHYNVLRTLEDMFDLPHVGKSAAATPITDVWRPA